MQNKWPTKWTRQKIGETTFDVKVIEESSNLSNNLECMFLVEHSAVYRGNVLYELQRL